MEIRMDSRPWADDHSSPRSPLHVLPRYMSVQTLIIHKCRGPNTQVWIWRTDQLKLWRGRLMNDLQADLALGIDIRVEATSSPVCCRCEDRWCLARIFCTGIISACYHTRPFHRELVPLPNLTENYEICQNLLWTSNGCAYLKEAEFIRSIWRPYDDGLDVSDIHISTCHSDSFSVACMLAKQAFRNGKIQVQVYIHRSLDFWMPLNSCSGLSALRPRQ